MATIEMQVEPVSEASPRPVARWLGLDLARLFASLAIIWIHVPRSELLTPTTLFARFAVPFFTCTAIYFVVKKAIGDGFGSWSMYAISRVQRLYLPFLAWSAFYLALKLAKSQALPEQENDFGGWEMLWVGSAYHLWFLPFILVVSLVTYSLGLLISQDRATKNMIARSAIILGTAIAIAAQLADSNSLGWIGLIGAALPSVCWGFALAVAYPRLEHDSLGGPRTGLMLFSLASVALCFTGRMTLVENLAGVGFMLFACTWRPDVRLAAVAAFGSLAYGVYCSHLAFIKIGEAIAAKLRLPVTASLDVAIFLVTVAASIACAWLLSRTRLTRWLVA